MRIFTVLVIAAALTATAAAGEYVPRPQAPGPAMQSTGAPGGPGGAVTPDQRESIQKLTALFIITVFILLLVIVGAIVMSIVLRRRLRRFEKREAKAATELEDLWWKMGMPGASGDKKKKKP